MDNFELITIHWYGRPQQTERKNRTPRRSRPIQGGARTTDHVPHGQLKSANVPMLTDFQNSLAVILTSKFVTKSPWRP